MYGYFIGQQCHVLALPPKGKRFPSALICFLWKRGGRRFQKEACAAERSIKFICRSTVVIKAVLVLVCCDYRHARIIVLPFVTPRNKRNNESEAMNVYKCPSKPPTTLYYIVWLYVIYSKFLF